MKLNCELIANSDVEHLQQIYTGFNILHLKGFLELKQIIPKEWKLGEYVALSKAIITEPLHFQLTGNFANEINYLEFTSPNELVNAAVRLFENKNLRFEMMIIVIGIINLI